MNLDKVLENVNNDLLKGALFNLAKDYQPSINQFFKSVAYSDLKTEEGKNLLKDIFNDHVKHIQAHPLCPSRTVTEAKPFASRDLLDQMQQLNENKQTILDMQVDYNPEFFEERKELIIKCCEEILCECVEHEMTEHDENIDIVKNAIGINVSEVSAGDEDQLQRKLEVLDRGVDQGKFEGFTEAILYLKLLALDALGSQSRQHP